MSSQNAIGRAIRRLYPHTCGHGIETPNSRRLHTPERAVDMKVDITREPERR
jgi:hypothetical protein